eukprot:UN07467
MKAINAAFICFIVCIKAMAQQSPDSPSHQLATRLAELSDSGKITVTQNKDGDFVIHTDTVIEEQNDNQEPKKTKSQDAYIVPAELYDEAALRKMWEEIWSKNDATKQVISTDSTPPAIPPLPATDAEPLQDKQVPVLDDWMLVDDINLDKLLKDDFVIPNVLSDIDYSRFADNYMNFMDYDGIWKFDEATGEWILDPVKYEKKYGIKPYTQDNLGDQIKSLQQDITDEQKKWSL